MEVELWGMYSDYGVRHLMIEDTEESHSVFEFFQRFFQRRDEWFSTDLERVTRDGDNYTFNFYDHEFADTFLGFYSAEQMATFLEGIIREDDFQAQEFIDKKLRIFDDYYTLAYPSCPMTEHVWWLFFAGDVPEDLILKKFQSSSVNSYYPYLDDYCEGRVFSRHRPELGELTASPQLKYTRWSGNPIDELKNYLLREHPAVLVVQDFFPREFVERITPF
jgi:hypothetical protein